jgi:glycosyltransferase involved in cell wall biosynthesis
MLQKLDTVPRVTIGLPVYNGENYLEYCINSILDQTYEDFELVICDNASTDRTSEICVSAAERDSRVHYHRNKRNLGAARNYDLCFELGRGEFFKWQAHDDLVAPTYLEECVAALDANPDAVLCQSRIGLIDAKGRPAGVYDGIVGSDSPRASRRFAATVLVANMACEIFGLARRESMEGAPLHGTYNGSDTVHLAAMALKGRFLKVDEPLFMNRTHPNRYSEGIAIEERSHWYCPDGNVPRVALWAAYCDYFRLVNAMPDLRERLACYGYLGKWWFSSMHWAKLLVDFLSTIDPRIHRSATRIKQRIFGLRQMGIDWDTWRRTD